MSAYSVMQDSLGGWVWWENWRMASASLGDYKNIRPATNEESALMDKVVWDTATAEERGKLRALIKSQELDHEALRRIQRRQT